jgi:hypothetical protein
MKIDSQILELGKFDKNIPINSHSCVQIASVLIEPYDNMIENLLQAELVQWFEKKISSEMSQVEDNLDVIDFTESESVIQLYHYLQDGYFDFIICSTKIGTILQDSILFSFSGLNTVVNSYFNKIGHLASTQCYVSNFKKWDDLQIICGKKDCFWYNYKVDEIKNTSTGHSVLDFWYGLHFKKDSFINLNFVNEYHPNFKQINRDRAIKNILDKN